jgi:hypothetical protein
MPVLLSADGILYDGHQRLQLLAELGRKAIGVGEFILNPKVVGREAAYMEAIQANQNRRHLTGKMKAEAMWNMVRQFKLSQTTIATRLGMRQQSVSELMRKYPPADIDDMPAETVGADGKTYPRGDVSAKSDQLTPGDYRARLKKQLTTMRVLARNGVDDSAGCGHLDGYERAGIAEDIAAVKVMLDTIASNVGATE